jgi:DNA-directed RNA polymerase specialized sigma24 family protein
MRYLEERSVREIAAATHIAEGTVRATVHHAVSALRRKLRVPR